MRKLAGLLVFVCLAAAPALALADVEPEPPKKSDEESDCSVSNSEGSLFGLSVLVLLISGASLRRRRQSGTGR